MRILLVEDDSMIGKAVQQGLKAAGFSVDWTRSGQTVLASLSESAYNLVLLDLGLPAVNGLDLLKNMRSSGNHVPVLIITARDAIPDRIAGLDAGADDYVVKPFDLDEVIARIRSLLRRNAGSGVPILECGPLTLDPAGRIVRLRGEAIDLSAREFTILEALMRKPGAILSRMELEAAVYSGGDKIDSNVIEVHLHNLRRKIGAELIRNIRGVGYRIAEG